MYSEIITGIFIGAIVCALMYNGLSVLFFINDKKNPDFYILYKRFRSNAAVAFVCFLGIIISRSIEFTITGRPFFFSAGTWILVHATLLVPWLDLKVRKKRPKRAGSGDNKIWHEGREIPADMERLLVVVPKRYVTDLDLYPMWYDATSEEPFGNKEAAPFRLKHSEVYRWAYIEDILPEGYYESNQNRQTPDDEPESPVITTTMVRMLAANYVSRIKENKPGAQTDNFSEKDIENAFVEGVMTRHRMLGWARDLIQAGIRKPEEAANILERIKNLI